MLKEQCIDTIQSAHRHIAVPVTWKTWLKTGLRLFVDDVVALFDVLATWQRRARERHQLQRMSDYMLNDMGVSRAEAASESRKPFWRA